MQWMQRMLRIPTGASMRAVVRRRWMATVRTATATATMATTTPSTTTATRAPMSTSSASGTSAPPRWYPRPVPASAPASSPPYLLLHDVERAVQRGELTVDGSARLRVQGWVRTVRTSKTVTFVVVHDGSCFAPLQVVMDRADAKTLGLSTGTSVRIDGTIHRVASAADAAANANASPLTLADVELRSTSATVLGACPPTYPMSKQYHSLEFLREQCHLRFRTNTIGAITRVRSVAHHAVNEWFRTHHFVHVHTPILTPLDCEGGGETFNVSAPSDRPNELFFGKPVTLGVSGQLYAEMVASALTRVYTFGPTFRAETCPTPRHLAEFWMIEPEIAFADLHDAMDVAEQLIVHVIRCVLAECADEIAFFNERVEKGLLDRLHATLAQPFARVTYTDAVKILNDSKHPFEVLVQWGDSLQSEHEKWLAEVHYKRPVFVTNYPLAIKPFYMRRDDNCAPGRETVACMDLLVPHIGELIGGSQREERYDLLHRAMIDAKLPLDAYQWYLDLRRYGTVPHAGFGVGFERLLRFVSGLANVRDVIAVPRVPGLARF